MSIGKHKQILTTDEKQIIRTAIIRAIEGISLEEFKKTSFFMRNMESGQDGNAAV